MTTVTASRFTVSEFGYDFFGSPLEGPQKAFCFKDQCFAVSVSATQPDGHGLSYVFAQIASPSERGKFPGATYSVSAPDAASLALAKTVVTLKVDHGRSAEFVPLKRFDEVLRPAGR
jgi:hypothetical protein